MICCSFLDTICAWIVDKLWHRFRFHLGSLSAFVSAFFRDGLPDECSMAFLIGYGPKPKHYISSYLCHLVSVLHLVWHPFRHYGVNVGATRRHLSLVAVVSADITAAIAAAGVASCKHCCY